MSVKKKLALIGAGAVGAYLIHNLAEAEEIEFAVVAEGERKARLQAEGLRINGKVEKFAVKTPGEAGICDLIILATKYQALDSAIAMLPAMIGPKTMVMSLLNGVDSEERIEQAIGKGHVIYSLMRISSERRDGGVTYTLNPDMGIFYGIPQEKRAEMPADALDQLAMLFAGTPLYTHYVEDILQDIWYKYAGNMANNLPQAVLQVPARLYMEGEHGRFIADRIWQEVGLVAQAKGIRLPKETLIWDYPGAKYSTLQDIEAGRRTEIDMFTGTLLRMAAELGIAVPYSEYTHHLIKALEEKNEGLFS